MAGICSRFHSLLLRFPWGCPQTLFAQVALDPFLAQLPVVERITKAPVFEFSLISVGDQPPDQAEADDLWSAIDMMRQQGPKVGIPLLEQFIQTYTNSTWIPSLHADLGDYYRNNGRYSLALEHWQAARDATKAAPGGTAKSVADHALAHLTRLLASLGRTETLAAMFQDTWNRTLDAGPLQQLFEDTKEAYGMMLRRPGISFRCGTLALSTVAYQLRPGNTNLATIVSTATPTTGLSLSSLKQISDHFGLNLAAVDRGSDTTLIVPSVIQKRAFCHAARRPTTSTRRGNMQGSGSHFFCNITRTRTTSFALDYYFHAIDRMLPLCLCSCQ